MLRLLHTADWHLGRRFPSFEPHAARALTRARLDAVQRLLALGERLAVDAILCAGDLFDEPAPDAAVTEPLAELLAAHERPIVLLPGNHDPLGGAQSPWDPKHPFRRALPDSVHVVDRDDFELELEGGVIVASPCRSTAGAAPVAERLPARREGDERVRVGLAHGSTFGSAAPFPVEPESIAALGLDYLALGDHHGLEVHGGATTIAYPGTPEPTSHGESHAGHVLLAMVARGRAFCEPEAVHRWHWRDVTIEGLDDLAILADDDLGDTVLRVRFDATFTPAEQARAEALLTRIGRATDALTIERSGLRLDLTDADAPLDELSPLLADAGHTLLEQARAGDAEAERALRHLFRLAVDR
ncbi:MAG: DNA repair exonuclease [Deltaproteobacteria bacterium]|nr:DNA repair exonuclease [Deltaproteobacteria bacterium]